MKTLLILLTMSLSTTAALACQCDRGPMDSQDLIKKVLKDNIGKDITFLETKYGGYLDSEITKNYSTLEDKIALYVYGAKGTSCDVSTDKVELYSCSETRKFNLKVNLLNSNNEACEANLFVKEKKKKVVVRLNTHNC